MLKQQGTASTSTATTDRLPMTEADWFRRYNERPGDTVMHAGPRWGRYRMSFLDFLLASDESGEYHATLAADRADLTAGVTWGVFDGDRLVETHPALFITEAAARDNADATDRPLSAYRVRPVVAAAAEVAA
jgi:hypothetical protein